MRSKIPYYFIKLFNILRRLLFLFLILYVTSTPVVTIMFHQFDLDYELCEIYGEEELIEKEMIVDDFENEDHEFNSTQNGSSIYFHRFLTAFDPDIQLPPPRNLNYSSSF